MKRPERKFPERKTGTLQANPEPLHIGAAENNAVEAPAAKTKAGPAKSSRAESAKKPVTTPIDRALLKEAHYIVERTRGHRTFVAMLNAALQQEVQRFRDELNNGEPFPYDDEEIELRKGRPLGS